jgi:hypothetical protein
MRPIQVRSPTHRGHKLTYSVDTEIILFRRWEWASNVQQSVISSQTESELEELGGAIESFSDTIHFLKQPDNLHTFRTDLMMEKNAAIFERLAIREPPPQFSFVPLKNDTPYWKILEVMDIWMELLQPRFGGLPNSPRYEIWKFAQQFSLACRRRRNARNVVQHLIRSNMFRGKFWIRRVSSESTPLRDVEVEIVDHQWLAPPKAINPSSELTSVSDEGITLADIRWHFASQPIDDPRRYVEVIPWEELTLVSDSELSAAHIEIFLQQEPDMGNAVQKWMLWKLPSCHFFDSHHLYTEFETYNYCVTHGWFFPGHSYRDAVIFALSPLEQTEFVEDLKNFWDRWVGSIPSVNGHLLLKSGADIAE